MSAVEVATYAKGQHSTRQDENAAPDVTEAVTQSLYQQRPILHKNALPDTAAIIIFGRLTHDEENNSIVADLIDRYGIPRLIEPIDDTEICPMLIEEDNKMPDELDALYIRSNGHERLTWSDRLSKKERFIILSKFLR